MNEVRVQGFFFGAKMEVLSGIDLPAFVVLLLLSVILIYLYGTWPYGVWKSLGVGGPTPSAFVGHQYLINKEGTERCFEQWTEAYGRTFGIYVGRRPVLVTSDPEVLKTVLVKEFNKFPDRFDTLEIAPLEIQATMPFAQGARWKKLRSLLTPTFSTGKLKQMEAYLQRCSNHLAHNIEQAAQRGEKIDVKKYFGAFTLDAIGNIGFGIQLNSQNDLNDPFVKDASVILTELVSYEGLLRLIAMTFPSLIPLVRFVVTNIFPPNRWNSFSARIHRLIEDRKQEGNTKEKVDLLQTLLNHEETEGCSEENMNVLTRLEVTAQVMIIFLAGYETTASTLQYLAYSLALHPEIQEKIIQEIEEQLGDDAPTYESVKKLKYLDNAIHETLRMFPPANSTNRIATEEVTIKGVTIPKGAGVIIPISNVLKDPAFFPEPDKFTPERFSEDNVDSISFLPFGFGPRQCIGMRLSMLEVKVAMVHVLRRVKFVKTDDLPEHLVLKTGSLLNLPERVIEVKAVLRDA